MSYLDYKLTMEIKPNEYISGYSRTMNAVAVLTGTDGKVIGEWDVTIPPVTGEKSVREAFCSLYSRSILSSWQERNASIYHSGDFVRVVKDSACHGFPIGSIVRLDLADADDDEDGISWLAEGYTTSVFNISKRWIGEEDFVLVTPGTKEEENE